MPILFLLVAGCGDSYVWLEPVPETDGAEALLLAAHDSLGAVLTVEPADSPKIEIPSNPDRGAVERVEALAYGGPLRDLGLQFGPLARAEPGQPGWILPEPLSTHEAIPRGRPAMWTAVDGPSAPLREQRYALTPPCRSFTEKRFTIDESLFPRPGEAIAAAAVRVTEDQYLVFVTSNGFGHSAVLADPQSVSPVPSCPQVVRVAMGDGTGDFWAANGDGLAHISYDVSTSSCTTLKSARFEDSVAARWIAGRIETPIDLYVLRVDGRLYRYDGQSLTEIVRRTPPDADGTSHRGGLAYLGEGEGIAMAIGDDTVTVWSEAKGERRISIEAPVAGDALHTLRYVEGIGLIASFNFGSLFLVHPDTLTYEVLTQTPTKPDSFEAFESGMIVQGDATIVQYYPAFGLACPEYNISRGAATQVMIVQDDGTIFLPDSVPNQGDDPAQLLWLLPY